MMKRTTHKFLLLASAMLALSGCNAADRISNIGQAPPFTPLENPTEQPGYQPVRLPMPAPERADRMPNSLWQAGSRSFFKDQRANRVGDILTVLVKVNDIANISNETKRQRTTQEQVEMPHMLGLESQLKHVLPNAVDPADLVDQTGTSIANGKGTIARTDQIELKVAALVTQVLPNGNLVVQGRQEITVNFDKRDLTVSGVIRPEDISSQNSVNYDQIAEARILYGGEGTISDIQQPRYGQQLFDIISPF